MKKRTGFVSNSSSSSFLIGDYSDQENEEMIIDIDEYLKKENSEIEKQLNYYDFLESE